MAYSPVVRKTMSFLANPRPQASILRGDVGNGEPGEMTRMAWLNREEKNRKERDFPWMW